MITFDRVTFSYPETVMPVFRDAAFEISEGTFVVVTGLSGSGKSTLLRCFNGLIPHFSGGTIAGRVDVDGLDPVEQGPQTMCRHVGFVFQDPEAQFVMDRVEDEVAFALENAAVPRPEMVGRVNQALAVLGLDRLRRRSTGTLSGGEKQRVAIAAALALRPKILVLDEPTSQLDAQSAEEVLSSLARLNKTYGLTVILAEHRLERVLSFSDQIIHLSENGGDIRAGSPTEIMSAVDLAPPVVEVAKALGWSPLPSTVEAAKPFAEEISVAARVTTPPVTPVSASALRAEAIDVAYDGTPILHGVSLDLFPGEATVLMGRNGAGKSTLLKSLVGLVRPQKGHVYLGDRDTASMEVAQICRHIAYLPQDPNALLFADRVQDELEITLRNHGLSPSAAPVEPRSLLARLRLLDHADDYPRDLSVGERQRVALASILVTAPKVILLDEPTRGLDYRAKDRLIEFVKMWREEGRALLLVTHDVELIAAVADRVIVIDEGEIVEQGAPSDVLRGDSPFAPQVARLFPSSGWLTVDDVLAALT